MVCHHMPEGGFCPCGTTVSLAGMPQAGVQSRSICTWIASTIFFTSRSFTTVEALMTAIWIMCSSCHLVRCAGPRWRSCPRRGAGGTSKFEHERLIEHVEHPPVTEAGSQPRSRAGRMHAPLQPVRRLVSKAAPTVAIDLEERKAESCPRALYASTGGNARKLRR